MFYFLCLYKTVNFDTNIEKSSFIILRYDLFDRTFVYWCSFSASMVEKNVIPFDMKKFMLGCSLKSNSDLPKNVFFLFASMIAFQK